MEFDDVEPMWNEDDLEEFERNQLVNDREYDVNDEPPPEDVEEGELIGTVATLRDASSWPPSSPVTP